MTLDSRLLTALSDGNWLTRRQIAAHLRPELSTRRHDVLQPEQVDALNALVEAGAVERMWHRTRGVQGYWLYRKAAVDK